jgi:hypothetical protein
MIAVKLSRECNKPGHDNRVDVAGYVETLDMVVEKQSQQRGRVTPDLVDPKQSGNDRPTKRETLRLLTNRVDSGDPVGEVPF